MKTEVARPTPGIQIGGSPLEEAMQRGVSASEAGDKDTAYAIFKQVTADYPNAMEGWVWLGWTSPDVNESDVAFRRAHDIDPSNEEANLGLRWVASQREMLVPEVAEVKYAPIAQEASVVQEAPEASEVPEAPEAPKAAKSRKTPRASKARTTKAAKAPAESPLSTPFPATDPALSTGPFPGTGPIDNTEPLEGTGPFPGIGGFGDTSPFGRTGPTSQAGVADLVSSGGSIPTITLLTEPARGTGPIENTGPFSITGSLGSGALTTGSEATQVLPGDDDTGVSMGVLVAEPEAPHKQELAWEIEDSMQRGVAAAEAGDKFAAYDLFQQVVAHDPTRADAWVWLGGTSPTLDDSEVAFNRALQADPNNEEAQLGLRWVTARRRAAPAEAMSRQVAAAAEPERPGITTQVAEVSQEAASEQASTPGGATPQEAGIESDTAFARFLKQLNSTRGRLVLLALLVILWVTLLVLYFAVGR